MIRLSVRLNEIKCKIIDVKMDGSVLEEKSPFKMLGLTFFSKLDWAPRKLEP